MNEHFDKSVVYICTKVTSAEPNTNLRSGANGDGSENVTGRLSYAICLFDLMPENMY